MTRRLVVEGSQLAQAPPPRSTPGLAAPGASEGSEGLLRAAGGVGHGCRNAMTFVGDFLYQFFWKDACRVLASGLPCREVWEHSSESFVGHLATEARQLALSDQLCQQCTLALWSAAVLR